MTTKRVRACARKITKFHERFAAYFGCKKAWRHSVVYLNGLLLCPGQKNVDRIALRFAEAPGGAEPGQKEMVALQ